jgi:nicotinamidase-related amidase
MLIRHPLPLLTEHVPALTLTHANTCFLLQDLHNPFADPAGGWLAVRARDKVLLREFDEYFDSLDLISSNIGKLVTRVRAMNLCICFVCLGYRPPSTPSPFQRATGWTWDLSGENGAFPAAWAPREEEPVFAKPGWGALTGSRLHAHFEAEGVRNVVVLGTMLEFGVRQTVTELTDHGYQALIVSDGVAPLTQAGRSFTGGLLGHGMTKLRSTGETLELLDRLHAEGRVVI